MGLSDRLEQALNKGSAERQQDPSFRRMEQFLEAATAAGVSDTPRYGLPPADTIGRRPYDQMAELVARSTKG